VDDLSRAGNGVAKDDSGRVVFIPFTAPGDLVKARIVSQKSKFAQAELLEVLEPSAQRRPPHCPVFGRCGGCDWQHIDYVLQWQTKLHGVKEALSRVKVPLPRSWQEYPAEQTWSYRNRIQLHGHNEVVGFYARSSHTIVPIERCAIARDELNAYIEKIREQGRLRSKPFRVELELSVGGGVRSTWDDTIAASDFQQVNSEQNHNLQQWVMENISKHRPVLDLYGGSANLSTRLAPDSPHIYCVDLVVPENTSAQWPENITFHKSDVFTWVVEKARQWQKNTSPAEARSAIIDPPRGGMPEQLPEFIDSLERLNVTELIAVGCKTDTWARDVAGFVQRGWCAVKVAVFDFFPQTAHVESAALLRRE
jgi:tRNA/tmRNA/rRNA uracil-C5-methylase (TrmA/RlmC/RlmD family)